MWSKRFWLIGGIKFHWTMFMRLSHKFHPQIRNLLDRRFLEKYFENALSWNFLKLMMRKWMLSALLMARKLEKIPAWTKNFSSKFQSGFLAKKISKTPKIWRIPKILLQASTFSQIAIYFNTTFNGPRLLLFK